VVTATPSSEPPGHVLVIAHRGDSAQAPENTIPAMVAAAAAGADMVEFDVQRTLDDKLVVVHDTTFARTTNVGAVFPGRENAPVGTFTLREVKQLDAGSWKGPQFVGTPIPTLAELLGAVGPTRLKVLAELKYPSLYPGIEGQVAQALQHSGLVRTRRVFVHSFDASALHTFHVLAPTVPLGLLTTSATGAAHTPSWLSTLNPAVSKVTDSSVDSAAAARLEVFAWPESGHQAMPSQIERMVDDGVSGVITDDPRATAKLIDTDA
jgi:glycerophosphoryl diester phosphodiesterase